MTYNSKDKAERLFEIFRKVNKLQLNEQVLDDDTKENLIREFVNLAISDLKIDIQPNIKLVLKPNVAKMMKSFGNYDTGDGEIEVVCHNRNLADVLRSLGHELVHHKQNIENKLTPDSGETGSKFENQANEIAGILMRNFAKLHPEIFE